ncbi:MAG: DUF4296 domain-containing protein [Saprospiraceae bacterium]|nr:DUF4296 domain-containing protein [Saprospiraceae bacterium]
MRKVFFILSLSLLCWSCWQNKDKLPEVDTKLVNVLVDLHLAEAAAANLTSRTRDTLLPKYYDQVFQIHQMDAAEWKQTMDELQRQPLLMKQLYTQVLDTLEKKVLETREK